MLIPLVEIDLLNDDELATALEVTSESGQLHRVARVAVLPARVRPGLQQLPDDVLVADDRLLDLGLGLLVVALELRGGVLDRSQIGGHGDLRLS